MFIWCLPLTNVLLHNYYYRGKSHKQLVKNLIIIDNNINAAKTKLESIITEHDNYISNKGIVNDGNNFTSVDNLQLHHAKEHLDSFVASNQETQKTATIRALEEE